jgi:hypothetical protein
MARSAVADGIRSLAATPHVLDDYPTTPSEMERARSRPWVRLSPPRESTWP